MTPPDPDLPLDDGPLDDDALAVQAVVDDEATPEQRRRVARDPGLVAQVAALRRAVDAVAAPVEPPPPDVLATLRARALEAADEPVVADEAGADDEAPAAPAVVPTAAPARPVGDLGAARARRSRSLPPLPAVAAVVILLVVVGVGLLVAGSGGKDADTAATSGGDSAESADGGSEDATGSGAGGSEDATAAAEGAAGDDRPSDDLQRELLTRARARFGDDEELADSLREVDLDTLAVDEVAPEDAESSPSTTTAPPAAGDATSTTSTTGADEQAYSLAADPVVTRCDEVLRAAEPELDPVTAAVLVEVDGVPVLVLSNPVEVTDQAPSGVRLTALNAVDCSPRTAVLR